MKIATFNINSVNRRLPNLLEWLKSAKPDIARLQELKCTDAEFPAEAIFKAGYDAVWHGQKTWNGVAILSRIGKPIVTRTMLPGDPKDDQSRYLEAAVNGVLIGCLYLPNGNPHSGPKFAYKLAWFKRLQSHARTILKGNAPVVLIGDYNVAPTEIDIYPTKSWDDDALVQPESRAAYAKLIKQGYTDALRELNLGERIYTFWHYWRNSFGRNAGLRLDHVLLAPILAKKLTGGGVDRGVRTRPGASDHAPVDAPFPLVPGRGEEAKHGGQELHSRDAPRVPKPRDIYMRSAHIGRESHNTHAATMVLLIFICVSRTKSAALRSASISTRENTIIKRPSSTSAIRICVS